MIRILHTGDLHLDAPMRGLSAEKARLRRQEQRELVERICAIAREREIDLMLIAGDLFDGEGVYYETTQLLAQSFGKLNARVFIAPGNHDPYSDRSPYADVQWPENVHIFRSPYFERVELPELKTVVYGAAFTSKYRDNPPLEQFRGDYDDDLIRLLVFHGDTTSPRSRYGAVTEEQLADAAAHYVALGHIHAGTGLRRAGETAWGYCGCPEGRGFDETGEKGVLLGTVTMEGAELEFLPTCKRRYQEITVDVTGKDPEQALLGAAPVGCDEDIFRFRLVGERKGEIPAEEALLQLLQGRFFDVQVRDDTVPAVELWSRLEEDTLTGLFLRNLRDRLEHEGPEMQALLERAARYGLAALEGREEPR